MAPHEANRSPRHSIVTLADSDGHGGGEVEQVLDALYFDAKKRGLPRGDGVKGKIARFPLEDRAVLKGNGDGSHERVSSSSRVEIAVAIMPRTTSLFETPRRAASS